MTNATPPVEKRDESDDHTIIPIVKVPIDSIHPDPANANQHDEADIRGLMAKLSTFTQVEPLLVQAKTRKVIGGNGRLEAVRRLGWTEVEVRLLDVDNVTATAMAIALNTRQSELDDDILAKQIQSLDSEGWDLDSLGFTDADLKEYLGDDDQDQIRSRRRGDCPAREVDGRDRVRHRAGPGRPAGAIQIGGPAMQSIHCVNEVDIVEIAPGAADRGHVRRAASPEEPAVLGIRLSICPRAGMSG